MKAAERMRPILEAFLQQKEEEGSKNVKYGKKRRRRTCFSSEAQDLLNDHFSKNPRPLPDDLQVIANDLGLEVNTVKVWFCNRKQNLKRNGQPLPPNTVKHELAARRKHNEASDSQMVSSNDFQQTFTIPSSQVKQILSTSPSTGSMTSLPFILSPDGVSIVSSPNPSQGSHVIPQFLTSSMSQQVVLSQVPFVTAASVMNQGITGVVSVSGMQPVQVLTTRQIPAQVLYQVRRSKSCLILGFNELKKSLYLGKWIKSMT